MPSLALAYMCTLIPFPAASISKCCPAVLGPMSFACNHGNAFERWPLGTIQRTSRWVVGWKSGLRTWLGVCAGAWARAILNFSGCLCVLKSNSYPLAFLLRNAMTKKALWWHCCRNVWVGWKSTRRRGPHILPAYPANSVPSPLGYTYSFHSCYTEVKHLAYD